MAARASARLTRGSERRRHALRHDGSPGTTVAPASVLYGRDGPAPSRVAPVPADFESVAVELASGAVGAERGYVVVPQPQLVNVGQHQRSLASRPLVALCAAFVANQV